jgi:hypothetical protein
VSWLHELAIRHIQAREWTFTRQPVFHAKEQRPNHAVTGVEAKASLAKELLMEE